MQLWNIVACKKDNNSSLSLFHIPSFPNSSTTNSLPLSKFLILHMDSPLLSEGEKRGSPASSNSLLFSHTSGLPLLELLDLDEPSLKPILITFQQCVFPPLDPAVLNTAPLISLSLSIPFGLFGVSKEQVDSEDVEFTWSPGLSGLANPICIRIRCCRYWMLMGSLFQISYFDLA